MSFINLGKDYSKLKHVSFGLILIMMNAWLLFNVKAVFSSNVEYFKNVLTVYMLVTASIFANSNTLNPLFKINFKTGLIKYLLSFFGFYLLFSSIRFLIPLSNIITTPFKWGYMVVMFGLIVSFNEDVIFSAWLPNKIGVLPSAMTFGFFHWFVYNNGAVWYMAVISIIVAIFAGLIFQYIIKDDRLGIPVSSSLHTVFNLFSMGLLTIGGHLI